MLENLKRCSKCKEYKKKIEFYVGHYSCKECDAVYQKKKSEQRKKEFPMRKCRDCDNYFQPVNAIQRLCQNPCKTKPTSIAESNAAWLQRDLNKMNRQRSNNFNQGQLRIF